MHGFRGMSGAGGMPPDLAKDLFAAAKREGVTPAKWLRAALDTFGRAPAVAAAAVAGWNRAPRSFPPPRSPRAAPKPPPARGAPPAPQVPRAPLTGFAWEARNLTDRAMKPDPIWQTRYAQAQGHMEKYGTGLAFLTGKIAPGNVLDATAESFGRSLDAAKAAGARSLLVTVDSTGGDVREGLAMIGMLEKFSKEVGPTIAFVSGCAESMAAIVAVACDYAIAAPTASLLVHGVSGGTDAERAHLTSRITAILAARTLVPANDLDCWLTTEIPLNAYDAHTHGLVNEVAGGARAQEIARRCTGRGPQRYTGRSATFVSDATAWGSWRRRILAERAADAQGVRRYEVGP